MKHCQSIIVGYCKVAAIVCCLIVIAACADESSRSSSAGEMTSGETNAGEMTAGEMTAGEMTAGETSAGEMTAGETSAGEMTAGETSAGEMTAGEGVNEITLDLEFISPNELSLVTEAQERGLRAIINIDPVGLSPFISWDLTSNISGRIPVSYDSSQALIEADLSSIPNQDQTLTLTARIAPDYEASFSVNLLRNCELALDFESELNSTDWRIMGSARRDDRGWLEMTGNQRQVAGGLFLVGAPFNPGDLDVSFKIAAGACDELGTCVGQQISDGYAMSIWNIGVQEIDALWELIGVGGNGASLSYTRLMEMGFDQRPEGFTIEFDTFANYCPNNGFYDPVPAPHVEMYFDGRYYMSDDSLSREERCMITEPGLDYPGYWSETSAIIDNQWHDINVKIQDHLIQVTLDGALVIDTIVPNFEFKGGVLAFSGGSGAVPAFQRFDDLVIATGCSTR